MRIVLFRLQKYKKFESNSQRKWAIEHVDYRCFDCKSTKNLRAIHNKAEAEAEIAKVVSTAKVQKIWEQFTTEAKETFRQGGLFRLQKYKKFESNSQPSFTPYIQNIVVSTAKVQKIWEQFTTTRSACFALCRCFDCKSTKNLRAIHNAQNNGAKRRRVVSTAKVQKIWEQFTTELRSLTYDHELFRLQKYKKFESNSQHNIPSALAQFRCFDCKSTKNLRAIHNDYYWFWPRQMVVSTAKVQKIWEQFTTKMAVQMV